MFTPLAFKQPQLVTNGLVLYLDAADRTSYVSGSTVWRNLPGGVNGSLINGPAFNAGNGGSIVFDGVDDYVDFGNNFDLGTNPFTLEYFAKTTTNPNQYSKIIGKGYYLQGGWTSYFGRDPNTGIYGISFQYGNSSTGWMGITGADNILLDTYYHVVYTKDSNNLLSSYINGVFITSKTETYNFTSPTFNYFVGRPGASQEWFKGNIGIVRQYNRGLSASEILQNFNAQRQRFNI